MVVAVRMPHRIAVVALTVLAMGCYTLQPVSQAVPPAGARVAYSVNDAGRVALGGIMGPEIAQIEGRLIETDAESYLIAVSTVRLLRGGEQIWNGEQVRVKSEYLGPAYERRFSRARSVTLGTSVLGAFAAFLITRSLIGSGSDGPRTPVDTTQTRIARP